MEPRNSRNAVWLLQKREIYSSYGRLVRKNCQFTDRLIKRLGLEGELEGHKGCVNCLQWNSDARLLASGSDDTTVIIWDPFRRKPIQTVMTQHMGNIFSVKFLGSDDSLLASAAADCGVVVQGCLRSSGRVAPILDCSCHTGRVKRLATAPDQPLLFWSAAEDGIAIQYDLREPHVCSSKSKMLISVGYGSELKCIAVNPTKPHYIAVGADDCFVRVYDRRMFETTTLNYELIAQRSKRKPHPEDPNCVQYYAPGHLARDSGGDNIYKLSATYIAFNSSGSEMLLNLGGEQIYLFDVNYPRSTNEMRIPQEVAKKRTDRVAKVCHNDFSHSKSDVLNGNACACDYIHRASKLYKRKWIGDLYSAARDYLHIIQEWPDNQEGYFGLIRCLVALKWLQEASDWLEYFCRTHPAYQDCEDVKKIKLLLDASKSNSSKKEENSVQANEPAPSEEEQQLRLESRDHEVRFVGHCNTTTDIKEVNFLGEDGKYVCAGSDDGIIFIWDRHTTKIVHALIGDSSIVNCVQPHPSACFIASSGIDFAVKLWSPLKEDGSANSSLVKDLKAVVESNQTRMSMDPFETLIANMGYRVRDTTEGSLHEVLTCRTS